MTGLERGARMDDLLHEFIAETRETLEAISGEIVAWEAEQTAYSPPEPPPYRVYKLIFVQRQTPEEAATLEAALNAEDAKMRLMYNAAEYFLSDDSLFAYLHWVVAVALGTETEPNFARADELLAPMER